MTNETKTSPSEAHAVTSHGSLLGMLSWRVFGPVFLISSLFLIAQTESWFHAWDLAFLGTIAFMVGGHYIEQRSGKGRTLYDEPSTWRHFASYTRNLIIMSLVVWVAIKAITVQEFLVLF